MKEITIISGKGGTGKTSVTAALASVIKNTIFCDSDVNAADLHLIFNPEVQESNSFLSGYKVNIHNDLCTNCGECAAICRYNAINLLPDGRYDINAFKCEGCRLCERICRFQAIESNLNLNNKWFVSTTRFGKMVHARIEPGEENSGKLVSQIRKRSKELAVENHADFILNDGPPGIGCAAISSISGVDLILMVVEPSKSALHDADRLIKLIEMFDIKVAAIINKSDINEQLTNQLKHFLKENNVDVLGLLPFTEDVVNAMIAGKNIVEFNSNSFISKEISNIWKRLQGNFI